MLAHELLHLALRTHDRARGSGRLEFNYAHDYIINDMLRHALGVTTIPAGGLDMPGAREKSAEEIVLEMRRTSNVAFSRTEVWEGAVTTLEQVLGAARQATSGGMGDVLDARRERELFPDDSAGQAKRAPCDPGSRHAQHGASQGRGRDAGPRREAGSSQQKVRALRGIYRTPWQLALQIWLEGVAPGERTFTRASRRGSDRNDVVMPGRKRYSWMLNVVLDTSASMSDEIPLALGAIADFCDATGVDEIRLVQCDTVVTSDEVLSPSELADYQVSGYGGSDLTPALLTLAEDPRVTAAVVITDGDIGYPSRPRSLCGALGLAAQHSLIPAALRASHHHASRERAMKVIQELVAYFDRRGKLSRRQLRGLLEQNFLAADAPTNMHGLCETVGATYYFRVTGVTEGQLWGTDIYSGDSTIGAAAVHAGLLKPGETDLLRVTVVTPPEKFPGTLRNGVTSTEYGRYQYAWKLSARCRSGSGGNSVGVVSVLNLESSGVGAPERRPRHDKRYHEV